MSGKKTHGAELPEPQATEWIANCVASNLWGKPERWVSESEEDVSGAIETREVEVFPAVPEAVLIDDETGLETIIPGLPAVMRTEYKLGATYTIEQIDISEEIEKSKKLEAGRSAQEFGAQMIAFIWAINETKQLTVEQFEQQMQNQTLANIERCLWNGAIATARALIALPEVQVYFSAQEIIDVLDKIDTYLA